MSFLNRLLGKTKQRKKNDTVPNQPVLSNDININKKNLDEIFKNCDDIDYRVLKLHINQNVIESLLVYSNSVVDLKEINENIIKPINSYNETNNIMSIDEESILQAFEKVTSVNNMKRVNNLKDITKEILSGNSILLINNCNTALSLSTEGRETRQVSESNVETIIRGPRDSFIEDININIGLVRAIIKSSLLKVENMTLGSETNTTVSILYMDNKANKEVLSNIMNKLHELDTDFILDSSYIEQYLEEHPYSPFPETQITELPDKVCANLLEGRIIILVDGSPIALILPTTFFQLFQSPEDYYTRIVFGNFVRLIRFLGFFLATSLPAIYIALISFHHEMLPMKLIVDLSKTRANVPFPPVAEAIFMELTVEVLREASIRLPQSIGQTISIVGAIVIGDAAIQSNFASPTMVIVVGITTIGSYVFPHYNTSYSLRIIRLPIIFMAATFGAFGIVIAWCWIIIHLCNLESFGYPYLSPLSPLDKGILKDGIGRGSLYPNKKSLIELIKRTK